MSQNTKTIMVVSVIALVFASALIVIGGIIYSMAVKVAPQDDLNAKLTRFENLRGERYTEMFLIGGNGVTMDLKGGVYNTVGLNSSTGTGDTCPAAILDKVDVDALKKQYNVHSVFKNGPRLWTLDWVEVTLGTERDFNGLKARWVTWLDVPKNVDLHKMGDAAYKLITVQRNTQFGFNKKQPVFILDDQEGNPWVMKSASLMVDSRQSIESLKDLGNRLALPPGWKFRVQMLDEDLILTPDNGTAHITQDDFGNTYDRAGGPYSNFKP